MLDDFLPKLKVRLSPQLDTRDRLTIEWPSYIQVSLGQETARIKACLICRKIFWAGRSTKSACSPQCTNTLNVYRLSERQKQNRRYRTLRDKRKAKSINGKES